MPDQTTACPECDSAGIETRVGAPRSDGVGPYAPDHRCKDCGARFDEVNRRAARHDQAPKNGLARALLEDHGPEDVGGDGR